MRYRGSIGAFLAFIGAKVPFIGEVSGKIPLQSGSGIGFATPIVVYSYIVTIGVNVLTLRYTFPLCVFR